eukprot:TRINITY_DN1918_c0_g1_i1.p1 TRINITY_DN1918_c0_g1~~TRINITY_DN1918_c0_g1_i1.p1  ORF type:complete len:405 (-),score=94.95 TRINITY_DN1918_c0_g1_i1:125-1339(-)
MGDAKTVERLLPWERVRNVLRGEGPVDRVPIVLGVSNATGIKMPVYQGIRRLVLGAAEEEPYPPERYLYQWPELGTALPEEAVLQRLGTDVRSVTDLEPAWLLKRNRERPAHSPYLNSWVSGATEVTPGDWVPTISPLRDATTVAEIENYAWPDMDDPTRVAHVAEAARKLREQGTFAVMGVPWLLFPLERAFAMQGMDTFLSNLITYPEMSTALLRKNTELCKQLMGHFLRECGDNIDLIKIGDDLGTQTSLLMSPRMYRNMLKPFHKDLIQFIKSHTKAKVFFHTDGDVFPLLEDLIEIGVDVLNPIQTSAGRMSDLAELTRRCANRLTLCGAIDTQDVLPNGNPERVRQEVHRVIGEMKKGAGGKTPRYMLGAVHTVMREVPPENVLAMVDAARGLSLDSV